MEDDPEDGGGIGLRRPIALAAVLLPLGLATTAAAQAYTERGPASPEQIATAKAEADRLIAAGKGEGVFVNESSGLLAQVRHPKSGLVCQFIPGAAKNAVSVYASGQVPRGDDVGCGHNINEIAITTFVTRYAPAKSVADVVRESLAEIPRNFTEVTPYAGQSVSVKSDEKPGAVPPRDRTVVRLSANFRGRAVFTRTAAAACGPWIVAQRATGPAEQALAADIAAEMDLNAAVASVCDAGRAGR
jgi:hypothetical protein